MVWGLMMIILSCIAVLWNNLTVYSELYLSSNFDLCIFFKEYMQIIIFSSVYMQ